MKYVSLDLETTGLQTELCQILEFAAVLEDTENPTHPIEDLPTFHRLVRPNPYGRYEPYALAMNSNIMSELSGYGGARPRAEIVDYSELASQFLAWLDACGFKGRVTLAGKNVAVFDYQFLPSAIQQRCSHRMIDVGSVYFSSKDGVKSSDQLLRDYMIRSEAAHDALTDARDVIQLLRLKYE